jgi:hypothetical protein
VIKHRGPGSEGRDAAGYNDTGSEKVTAVLKPKFKLSGARLDAGYIGRINIGDSGSLIPQSVADEAFKGNGSGEVIATAYLVSVQREGSVRVGDMGSRPGRTEQHSGRHGGPPEAHGFAENRYTKTL